MHKTNASHAGFHHELLLENIYLCFDLLYIVVWYDDGGTTNGCEV